MLGRKKGQRIRAINTRGRKRRPAPKPVATSDGKPPGLQSVKKLTIDSKTSEVGCIFGLSWAGMPTVIESFDRFS